MFRMEFGWGKHSPGTVLAEWAKELGQPFTYQEAKEATNLSEKQIQWQCLHKHYLVRIKPGTYVHMDCATDHAHCD